MFKAFKVCKALAVLMVLLAHRESKELLEHKVFKEYKALVVLMV